MYTQVNNIEMLYKHTYSHSGGILPTFTEYTRVMEYGAHSKYMYLTNKRMFVLFYKYTNN